MLHQLLQLEQRLAELKKEKHGLFSELKKVLHQENEIRQRETERQMKEQKSVYYINNSLVSAVVSSHAQCWLTPVVKLLIICCHFAPSTNNVFRK